MNGKKSVAVIAGTPVDTRMGVDYINKKNEEAGVPLFEPVYMPVAESCDAQVRFQYSDDDGKYAVIDNMFNEAIADGTEDFFIYCNSLSAAFDFDTYALTKSLETDKDIHIFTPLQIYRDLGRSFSCIGVIAANNLSAHAIEEALMASNPDIYVIGSGNMAIVRAIEDGRLPEDIAASCGLEAMTAYMQACGAEAIVLGCTHFPYLKEVFEKFCSVPIIDPANEMFKAMTGK